MRRKFGLLKTLVLLSAISLMMLSACGSEEINESGLYAAMNEWHPLNDWDINVSHIEYMDSFDIEGHDFQFVPRDGFRLMFVHVSARNNGDAVAVFLPTVPTFGSRSVTLNIGEERPWVPSHMALYVGGILQGRFDIFNARAAPGETIKGIIGFEVRIGILENTDSTLELHFSQSGERLVYNLRDS